VPSSTSKAIDGQFIVVLKKARAVDAQAMRNQVLKRNGMEKSRAGEVFRGGSQVFTGAFSKEEIERLKQDENVAFIEPEQALHLDNKPGGAAPTAIITSAVIASTQTIPWGVARVGYGDGTGKTVWVIDSGVQSDHPDLNVDKARSKSFIAGVTSYEDGFGHGTGVAGIIGAKNNSIGVVGVAANATIVALRVFDNAGAGTLTRIYSALNHVYQYGKPGDVVNMSLRVNASSLLDDLVKKTAARGIFIAVASGNSYIDCIKDSPARVTAPNVYVVSNMDIFGKFNKTSNYGASVRFAAPGSDIKTTWKGSGYATGNGTSYAAPHVAGILALNGGRVYEQGTVANDPDGNPDPIAIK
jgi:subtilisin family serine protease